MFFLLKRDVCYNYTQCQNPDARQQKRKQMSAAVKPQRTEMHTGKKEIYTGIRLKGKNYAG
jgi:hypothetical protein